MLNQRYRWHVGEWEKLFLPNSHTLKIFLGGVFRHTCVCLLHWRRDIELFTAMSTQKNGELRYAMGLHFCSLFIIRPYRGAMLSFPLYHIQQYLLFNSTIVVSEI